jgi:hypothetical protein
MLVKLASWLTSPSCWQLPLPSTAAAAASALLSSKY